MKIEQALYGEVKGGGHGLRLASGEIELAQELAPRLDLPDNAPPGAEWSPYVSGFSFRDRFVTARTFRDPNATRGGIVLAHAFISPLEEVVSANDIRPLFAELFSEPIAPENLATRDIRLGSDIAPAPPELSAVVAALLVRGSGPVVRIGCQNIEELVSALWSRLWPAVRRSFGFRMSFGPGDLIETPVPTIVCTPTTLVARWSRERLVDSFNGTSQLLGASVLTGAAEGQVLMDFAKDIGAELNSIGELPLLEQAYRLTSERPDEIPSMASAVRLVERLSPNPARGRSKKAALLNQLSLQMESASIGDILTFRNLTLASFSEVEQFWAALQERIKRTAYAPQDDNTFVGLVGDALNKGRASARWSTAVIDGLRESVSLKGSGIAHALWRWIDVDGWVPARLLAALGAHELLEGRLVDAVPTKLVLSSAEPLLRYAAKERLYRLHAVLAAASLDPADAIVSQMNIEPESSDTGFELILRKANPKQVVEVAVQIDDPRLVRFAALAIASKPGLLKDADMSSLRMRQIWAEALAINPESWKAPNDPQATFHRLLTELQDGGTPNLTLIARLATTPLGDLSSFGGRAKLWPLLSGATRQALIVATVEGWLASVSAGNVPFTLDVVLLDALSHEPRLLTMLDSPALSIMHALQVFELVRSLDEARFRRWLPTVLTRSQSISTNDADAIGRLVEERRWTGAAADLLRLYKWGREELKPALRACVSLISLLDRWLNNLSPLSSSEKWSLLADLAAELYPSGPHHDGLWERAGGKGADLGRSGSGRSQWQDALRQVGFGKPPRVDRLLREMMTDYGQNPHLRSLASDFEFRR